ncbi:MAG TPA: CAP domain-containing protein [Planktothrix sp.]
MRTTPAAAVLTRSAADQFDADRAGHNPSDGRFRTTWVARTRLLKLTRILALSLLLTGGVCCASLADAGELLAARHRTQPSGPAKQIFELSSALHESVLLSASGVACYVASSMGNNRGLLLKDVTNNGLGSNIGLSPGDVLLQIDSHVITDAGAADRVLASTPTGPIKVMFVHPGDSGLQLYNGNVRYINNSAALTSLHAGSSSSSEKSSGHGGGLAAQSNEMSFSAGCETYAIELINKDRKDHGSAPITGNSSLTALARMHAADMMKRNFFNHVNPDGEDPQARARRSGVAGGVYENISWEQSGHDSAASMVALCEARMMSEPPNQENHRYNILLPSHSCVGVGVCCKGAKMIMVQEYSDGNP